MTMEQEERMVVAQEETAKALTGLQTAMIAIASDLKKEPPILKELRDRVNWVRLYQEAQDLRVTSGAPIPELPDEIPSDLTT